MAGEPDRAVGGTGRGARELPTASLERTPKAQGLLEELTDKKPNGLRYAANVWIKTVASSLSVSCGITR